MSTEMEAMSARSIRNQVIGVPGQPDEISLTETRSKTIVGPVTFKLSNLDIKGLGTLPADPANSQYIIAANEPFVVSVDVEFNRTPLSELLMCLGTRINIDFGFEGFGVDGDEINLMATALTEKGVYKYHVETKPVRPIDVPSGMGPGLYQIGAVAKVGPVENKCTTKIWGHGYIAEVLLEVYAAGEE